MWQDSALYLSASTWGEFSHFSFLRTVFIFLSILWLFLCNVMNWRWNYKYMDPDLRRCMFSAKCFGCGKIISMHICCKECICFAWAMFTRSKWSSLSGLSNWNSTVVFSLFPYFLTKFCIKHVNRDKGSWLIVWQQNHAKQWLQVTITKIRHQFWEFGNFRNYAIVHFGIKNSKTEIEVHIRRPCIGGKAIFKHG